MFKHLEYNSYKKTSSFYFLNTYFFDDMVPKNGNNSESEEQTIPEHFHMLRHVVRSTKRPKHVLHKAVFKTRIEFPKTLAHTGSKILFLESYYVFLFLI